MSPDERFIRDTIDAARRRAGLLAAAEAAAWGAAVAAIWPAGGAIVALALAVWRSRAVTRGAVVRALERAHPDARNVMITAHELSNGRMVAKPAIRDRVFADAAARARQLDRRRAFSLTPFVRALTLASIVWIVVAARAPLGTMTRVPLFNRLTFSTSTATAPGAMRVTATIQPPSYTGLAATTLVDPSQLQAIEGSTLSLSIESATPAITVEQDGASRTLARTPDGRFTSRAELTKTGYLLITADTGARRLVPVVVSPDALPAVKLTAPGRDLRYAAGNPSITNIAIEARATDDFGLKSLALRYTKVSGSGEQFDFQEGELPLRVTQASGRDWTGSVSRSLAELNLKDGDMLVYRAVASDARPGDGSASSDAFFIEMSTLGATAGDAFTLPEEETKYALSQQMLIMKTERLTQQRPSMPAGDFNEAAQNLAVEQRMIRAEFVFMLGGEIEDEDVEAAQSNELQEGRLQNRGQRDLRAATVAMSQAEKLLTGANTVEALVAERAAVAALQRAFSKDRYILRALGARSQLDQTRRLTGNLSQAADWHRVPPDPAANRRLAQLDDLLRGISELTAATGTRDWRSRALVLAEQALRIDPASASLRQIATGLQRAADMTAAARSSALASAATLAAVEAQRAHAGGTLAAPMVAPALRGAFNDALNPVASGFSRTGGGRK
ncbi:MAG: DUF4175 domain-containing protein [Acidobacteriia bacterium]|nr:DUF4175 domain-containing protein [Terriglobia bacterium]